MSARAVLRLCALLLLGIFTAAPAAAKCMTRDAWRGDDKTDHAVSGATIAMAATLHTGSAWEGFLWGVGVGALKEAIDSTGMGTCSVQDFAVTAIGAGVGAGGGRLLLSLRRDSVAITYRSTF